MSCLRLSLLLLSLGWALSAADELQQLTEQLAPPPRFAAHQPQLSVVEFERDFVHHDRVEKMRFYGIKDGESFIAYMPTNGFHGGSIFLLSHDPAEAVTEIDFPSERFHLDNALGTSFRTDHFLPGKNWNGDGEESSLKISEDGSRLTIHRRYRGTLEQYKWELQANKNPLQVDHQGTFTLSFDPVFGYVIDGHWQTGVDKPEHLGQYVSLYPPDMSNPWITDGIHEWTLTSPVGESGYLMHANNHAAIDDSDEVKRWSLRDGGLMAFLDTDGGWSWAQSLQGGTASLGVCNVHADQDCHVSWPAGLSPSDDGLIHHSIRVRQVRLPPEITAHLAEAGEKLFTDRPLVVIRIGVENDFEDQPLRMDQTAKGITWPHAFPAVVGGAHSGEKCLQFTGTSWPNLPQITLQPNTRYRLQAWLKVEAATPEALVELEARHRKSQERKLKGWEKNVKKAEKQGEEPPPRPETEEWQAPDSSSAHIEADLFTWSPHNDGDRILRQSTGSVAEAQGWQQVELEFTAPAWGPFVDIRFVCKGGGTAYLDDFSLLELAPAASE